MSDKKVKIPMISITSEAEEDDDHNYPNIAGDLTDVETIDMETDRTAKERTKNCVLPKLMIKLPERDGGTTDVEDIQVSEDEEEIKIYPYDQTILLTNLDLDPGIFKETHKMRSKNSRGRKQLHTQSSTTMEPNVSSLLDTAQINAELTDVEDCYASDNDQSRDQYPEIAITEEMFETSASVYISDKIDNRPKPTPAVTPSQSQSEGEEHKGAKKNKKLLHLSTPSKILKGNLTDTEHLESDSNDEGNIRKPNFGKKLRRRKPRGGCCKNQGGCSNRSVLRKPCAPSSVGYESGNEEEKCSVKKKRFLKRCLAPDHDDGVLTEAEIFEDNFQISDQEVSGDYTALNKKIEEMGGSCSFIKEELCAKEEKSKDEDVGSTDCDDYKTDSAMGDSNEFIERHNQCDNELFNIKFIDQPLKPKRLPLPLSNKENMLTDVEIINSSDEENEFKAIPIAVIKKIRRENTTDEESFSDDGFYVAKTYPDIPLPQSFRKVISLRETQAGRPLVMVTAFDDTCVMGLNSRFNENGDTDEDSMSETEALLYVENMSRGPTPELSIFDCFEETIENLKRRRSSLKPIPAIIEALTDTEDLVLSTPKHRRNPGSKFLTAVKAEACAKTDTEDLYTSDDEPRRNIGSRQRTGDATDIENITISDDECLNEKVDLVRALSTTPSSMREMTGETVLAKEGLAPFSSKDRLNLNRRVRYTHNLTSSPMLTDTEDLFASADDEPVTYSRAETATPIDIRREWDAHASSKVQSRNTKKIDMEAPEEIMYLKGGYFREVHTDVEDMNMSDDEDHECMKKKKVSVDILGDDKVLVSMKHLCMNLKNCPVPLGFKNGKEWDASAKPSVEEPVSVKGAAPAVDAVQQGEGSGTWQATPESVSPRAPAPFRAGHEEGTPDVPTQGPSSQPGSQQRYVADQHELSEEMKQLLKEMEEDSKK